MKKSLMFVGLFLILSFFLISSVSAIPKDFEVTNVYWAGKGMMEDNKPFMIGLVELSWNTEKGTTSSNIFFLDLGEEEYYADSLGLVKNQEMIYTARVEAQFYPLETYASERYLDKFPEYTLIIPISENGEINFEKTRFSELDEDLTILDTFRIDSSDINDLSPFWDCSRSYYLPDDFSGELCDTNSFLDKGKAYYENGTETEEYKKCQDENMKFYKTSFQCSSLCLKHFYERTNEENFENSCTIYKNVNFLKYTSESFDFDELTKLNPNLGKFNPWREGP